MLLFYFITINIFVIQLYLGIEQFKRINKLKSKIKSFLFYIAIALTCLYLVCLATNYDYDLFARLIVGERFIEQGILPFKDFLSYTPTHAWYDHEWGSGVVFYFILKHFNAIGLLIFQAVMMFLTTVFVIKTQKLQKHYYPTYIIFTVIFLILFMRLNPTPVRCQLFSFLFFSIFLYILEGTRKNYFKGKYSKHIIWLIPPIVIIWNNLHGGVVSGLGLIAIYLFGSIVSKKPFKQYLLVLISSFAVLIINPYGIKYLNFLFSAATKNRKYIVEWWPFYAKRHVLYYIYPSLYAIFGFITSFRSKKNFDIIKFTTLAVTLYLGLAHVKLLSISIITASALCYNEITQTFIKFKWLKSLAKTLEKCLYPVIIILSLTIPLYSPTTARATFHRYPLYEIEFLKINNIKGNLVTPFGLGSYASYKVYPDILIYMDGRYEEVYNDKEFEVLRQYDIVDDRWEEILEKYPTTILMPYKHSLTYKVLRQNPNWVLIFDGKLCGIFVKKGEEKFSYFEPEYKIDYYRKTMFKHGDFSND